MDNNKKAEKRKQEDAVLNRALLWFAAAVVVEFLLLLVNKYYINFTTATESINLALAFDTGLRVAAVAAVAGAAGCGVWGWKKYKAQGKAPFLPALLGGTLLVIAISAVLIVLFNSTAMQLLYIAVPAGAVAALVFYLYQKEFFLSLCCSAVGMLGLWMARRNSGRYSTLVAVYVIAAVVLLAVVALAVLKLKKDGGTVSVKDKQFRLLPAKANYTFILLSCAVSAAAMLAGWLMGSTAAYYLVFVLMAWLFVLLVYYTVKLM